MNKFIVTMAIAAIGFSSAAAILPGTPYRLELKDTELCISSNGEGAKLTQQTIGDAAYEQTFVFVEVPEGASAEGYNIKTESGLYIDCTSNAWDIKVKAAADLKKKDNIFIIEEDGDYIKIKCRKNDKYFGKDKTAAGSGIYCDKSGGSTMILKASPIDAASVKAALEESIASAEKLLEDTEEGENEGQYPSAARAALRSAIDNAKSALDGDLDTLTAASSALAKAVAAYKDARVPAVFAEGWYMFRTISKTYENGYLVNGWQANSWESWNVMSTGLLINDSETAGYNKIFHVEKSGSEAEATGYTICDRDGYYMKSNSNNEFVYDEGEQERPSAKKYIFQFEEAGEGQWKIKSTATGGYVGPVDGTDGWSWIHVGTNHKGDKDACIFIAETYIADAMERLQSIISEAETLLSGATEGTEEGDYPATAINALRDAIDAAKAVTDEDDAEDACYDLQEAIEAFKLHQVPEFFAAGTYKMYNLGQDGSIFVTANHANSWETGNKEMTGMILTETEAEENAYNVEFKIEEASDGAAASGYTIADGYGLYLSNAGGKLYWGDNYNGTDLGSIFLINKVEDDVYTITNRETNKYVGPVDGTAGWNWIHVGTTHNGDNKGNLFRFVKIGTVGISSISDNNNVVVEANDGMISVRGAESAIVYRIDGSVLTTATGNADIDVISGLYIVKVVNGNDTKTVKVLVR